MWKQTQHRISLPLYSSWCLILNIDRCLFYNRTVFSQRRQKLTENPPPPVSVTSEAPLPFGIQTGEAFLRLLSTPSLRRPLGPRSSFTLYFVFGQDYLCITGEWEIPFCSIFHIIIKRRWVHTTCTTGRTGEPSLHWEYPFQSHGQGSPLCQCTPCGPSTLWLTDTALSHNGSYHLEE